MFIAILIRMCFASPLLGLVQGCGLLLWSPTPAMAQSMAQAPPPASRGTTSNQATDDNTTQTRLADLTARVELLTEALQEAREEQRLSDENTWSRVAWLAGGLGTLFTILLGFAGVFISNRMKDPEEWRENLRNQLLQQMRESHNEVTAQTTSAIEKTELRLSAAERSYAAKIEDIYARSRDEAREFQEENVKVLQGLRVLTELGQPSPGQMPEPETLYFLAEQARATGGAEGRANGLRYLRRLTEEDIQAFAPVLHNAAVLAKEYESQEVALKLFEKARIASGKSKRYTATYAHELASAHHEEQSLELFRELLENYPTDDHVFHFYVDALNTLELYEQAEEALEQHAEQFAHSARVQREAGDLFLSMGRLEDAMLRIDKAVALDPTDDIAWGYRARLAFKRGNLALARESVKQALRVAGEESPRLPRHFELLGDIEREEGNMGKAREAYRASIVFRQVPSRAIAWMTILEESDGHNDVRTAADHVTSSVLPLECDGTVEGDVGDAG